MHCWLKIAWCNCPEISHCPVLEQSGVARLHFWQAKKVKKVIINIEPKMRPIRTDFALSLYESEECVVTSSRAKSAEANQNSQLASLIQLWDFEQGAVVINDPPPTPVLSEGSEQSAKSSFDEIGKIWLHVHSSIGSMLIAHQSTGVLLLLFLRVYVHGCERLRWLSLSCWYCHDLRRVYTGSRRELARVFVSFFLGNLFKLVSLDRTQK